MSINIKTIKNGDKVVCRRFQSSKLLEFSEQHLNRQNLTATFSHLYKIGGRDRGAVVTFEDGNRLVWRINSLDLVTEPTGPQEIPTEEFSHTPCKEENTPVNTIESSTDAVNNDTFQSPVNNLSNDDKSLLERAGVIGQGRQTEIKFIVGKDLTPTLFRVDQKELVALLDNPKELAAFIREKIGHTMNVPTLNTPLTFDGFYLAENGLSVKSLVENKCMKDVLYAPLKTSADARGYSALSVLKVLCDIWNDEYNGPKTDKYAIIPAINTSGHNVYLIETANTYPRVLSFYSKGLAERFLSTFKAEINDARTFL